jgi:KDO2-lipid IV(A) lauroyltransferase
MLKARSRFGAFMVADTNVLRSLVARKGTARTIAMVADQTPAKESPHRLMFLNQPTLFFAGIEKIAVAIQAPIIFADVNRLKRGYYEITYYPLSTPPYDTKHPGIIEKYAAITETAILRQPHNWLWSHKRWKHKLD